MSIKLTVVFKLKIQLIQTNRKKERVNKRPDCQHPSNRSDTPVTACTHQSPCTQTLLPHTGCAKWACTGPGHGPHRPTRQQKAEERPVSADAVLTPFFIMAGSKFKVWTRYPTFSNLPPGFQMVSSIETHILLNTSLST